MHKSLIAGIALGLALMHSALAQGPDNFGAPISTMVSVSFADSSSTFRPTPEQIEMLADIRDAAMVTINGRTSTNKPNAKDEALALARAVAARAWLVGHGVSPLKILINYVSGADYAVDNSTPEGRYINQRVDIEVFYVPRV